MHKYAVPTLYFKVRSPLLTYYLPYLLASERSQPSKTTHSARENSA